MKTKLIFILLIVVVGVLTWLFFKQRRLLKEMQRLAVEAEKSQKRAEAEQERNRQLKQEMTNNIAHELKTPVSSIKGYLEILLGSKPVDDEKKRYFLERSYAQTIRLADLIRDVSLINKLEESASLFPKGPIIVAEVANEAIHELEEMAHSHGIEVQNHIPAHIEVVGNHNLIYAIFRNLVENSVNYAGDNIQIVMECYKENDEQYFLKFYDTGSGVDNAFLPKLFDRFVRIDQGRSRKNGGTGLGLSIVKHAVQFHGGDIYVRNREEGGLEYYFSLKRK